MKKLPLIVGGSIVILLTAVFLVLYSMSNYGPKFKEVSYLTVPRIVEKPDRRMLVVEATGDPNKTVGPAFGLLFKTWYTIKDRPKGKDMRAPRARWPKPLETPREQWVGIYALPAGTSVTTIDQKPSKEGLHAELRWWRYGTVAEILHVGPYSTEDSTVRKLRKFITESGYEICGDHEEEYHCIISPITII